MEKRQIAKIIAAFLAFSGVTLFADEGKKAKDTSPLKLKLTTDLAYYPESEVKPGRGTCFAPITGPYHSIECRTTFNADYKIDTPLGEHWLLSDANMILSGALELTPVSVRPKISVGFQPLPFFVVKGGSSVGFGWNYLNFGGLRKFNAEEREYENTATFSHPYYDFWGQAMLMFDTGALVPGDWNHVLMLASFTASYSAIAGIDKHEAYEWQCSKNKVSGAQYEAQALVAYQMPLILSMAGLMYTADGHFYGSDYGDLNKSYRGNFVTHSISPVLQFTLSEKDELFCLFNFSSRRRFRDKLEKEEDKLFMKTSGREWFFNRLALSWTHNF